MTLPNGISTCVVTFGKAYAAAGREATITGRVKLDRAIVHAASGSTIHAIDDEIEPSVGGFVSFTVPHVDQAGFRDAEGNALTNWAYVFTGQIDFGQNRVVNVSKPFQVMVGQTNVDLDLIPGGSITPGVTAPTLAWLREDFDLGDPLDDFLLLPPNVWQVGAGAAVLTSFNGEVSTEFRWPGWLMAGVGGNTDRAIQTTVGIPKHWEAFNLKLLWTNRTDLSIGGVAWRAAFGQVANGGVLLGAVQTINDVAVPAPAFNVLKESVLATGVPNDPSKRYTSLSIRRRGTDATTDTLDGDVAIYAVILERSA